ncbi:hypothetical protein [Flavobacterium sp. GT3R68]|uniref:hypothetical protein n=1 Tax=Flavobacterium sp. GT3R68 TaxID=2594437 RepID=UPI000F895014|nr:hypothetical protein [Flavobacterium sp. GT3R68]RTY90229.1 hypothetical protein EKL32_21410 [Flavobacterium sp. GSN2]TRW90530.1 hypothetical protein FNW07_10915 [Flavobacterium sp. GT3R68]
MQKLMYAFGALMLVLTSCTNDSASNSNAILLKRSISNSVTLEYNYNGNKLVSIYAGGSLYLSYTYVGDLITGYQHFNNNAEMVVEVIYEYDSNQRVASKKYLNYEDLSAGKVFYTYNSDGTVSFEAYSGDFASQNNATGWTGIYYLNANGEAIRIDEYNQGILDTRIEFTYDTKNSILKNITGYNKLFMIYGEGKINNILTGKLYNSDNVLESSYSHQYDYNSDNCPVFSYGGETIHFFYE